MKNKKKHIVLACLMVLMLFDTLAMPAEKLKAIVTRIANDQSFCTKLQLKEPELLVEFYCNNKYGLQWYATVQDALKRKQALKLLTDTAAFALNKKDYASISLLGKKPASQYDSLIDEVRTTDLMLYFLKDIAWSHQEFIKNNAWKYKPVCLDIAWLLQQAINTNDFEKTITEVEPGNKNYITLKSKYRQLVYSNTKSSMDKAHALKKIKTAIQWNRWISCMQNKSYVVINLAAKNLCFMECGDELFNSKIETGNIPFNDITLSAIVKSIRIYYDGNYPSTLLFGFDNPYQLAISSMDPCFATDSIHTIKTDKAIQLANALGINNEALTRSVCPEEATPYYEMTSRTIPLFIINIPFDF